MKTIFLKLGFVVSLLLMISCSDDNDDKGNRLLTVTEKNSLIFMLEEEKLARDTYRYLDNLWGLTEFENIKISEQAHMDAVAQQLDIYNVAYTILPEGQFNNVDLQNLYNQFVI